MPLRNSCKGPRRPDVIWLGDANFELSLDFSTFPNLLAMFGNMLAI